MNEHEPTKAQKPKPPSGPNETTDNPAAESRVASEHPVDEHLIAYVACQLQESHVSSLESHIAECDYCVRRIKNLYGNIGSIVSSLRHVTSPSPLGSDRGLRDETVGESIANQDQPTTVGYDYEAGKSTAEFGDYTLIDEIARGGMGVVYRARHRSLDRVVALKMIKSGEFANQEQVERFHKEAEAAAKLDHPGIVPVYDIGSVGDQHYFTMAFIDGESLSTRLRESPLAPKVAAGYAKSIAQAVAYAHSKGVIHRDLKPANVLITREDTVRVTDFGLAKRIEEDSELTSTGQILGTPSFMPPEQADGRLSEIGPAADVYSIGATLYCMLVGRPPFQAANVVETLHHVIESEPVSLGSLNPSIPRDLETLCLRCLEKKPSNRYGSAVELADELKRFLRGEPIHARPVGRVERTVRWCIRKPIHATALVLMMVLSVGGPWAAIQQRLLIGENAIAKVDALLNASPSTIPLILSDLDRDASLVRSRLNQLNREEKRTPSQRLRISLALLPSDATQLAYLSDRLNDCSYEELAAVLKRMRENEITSITPDLWMEFHSQTEISNQRFRRGIALAALSPSSEQWTDQDYQFLATSMLNEVTVYQPAIRQSLKPVAAKLLEPITNVFRSPEANETARESAAAAIVDFYADDSALLTELSMAATPKQHSILFPVVDLLATSHKSIVGTLTEVVKLTPDADYDLSRRVALGKRRAGAAINLIRMGRSDRTLAVLNVEDDPESLTQLVHGCRSRGVTGPELLNLLDRATSASERIGILLALGEFAVTDVPTEKRATCIELIKEIYEHDPHSGVHGASGWLLRKWGLDEEARVIEQREVPYSKDREWFTLRIRMPPAGDPSYFTFCVVPGGVYDIGSQGRGVTQVNKPARALEVKSFAILDREITRGEFSSTLLIRGFKGEPEWMSDPMSPMAGASWYMSVAFCRLITLLAGGGESDQAYPDGKNLLPDEYPLDPDSTVQPAPKNWPVRLGAAGFRLPTSAEWEIACRGGTFTNYSFGSDPSLLKHYGWYDQNSGQRSHRPRKLRPNPFGLFDMHGNMWEWCHNWMGEDHIPEAGMIGQRRILRGTGWDNVQENAQSHIAYSDYPATLNSTTGFRIVVSVDQPLSRALVE